jgi:hypothetical protein|tara:strand:- start:368 stop:988 length:621 start_codon:yes stop_codon:yes gene_type:complete
MHKSNVLIFGPSSFIMTLIELKSFLKFNLYEGFSNTSLLDNFDVAIIHKDFRLNSKTEAILVNKSLIKILATNENKKIGNYDGILKLPATINDLNLIIDKLSSKKIFNQNSSITIKDYLLDKNEKKLFKKKNIFIVLTEKEIQLLELFLNNNKPISKNEILSSVWHYSSDADTHTVETHIYRLRKKINNKFSDENFILNNKDGYFV